MKPKTKKKLDAARLRTEADFWWKPNPVRFRASPRHGGKVWGTRCTSRRAKFICLACRKVWRNHHPNWHELERCPQCGGPVVMIHRDSQIPRSADDRAWRLLAKRFAPKVAAG